MSLREDAQALRLQLDVIGALMMRELHTRFGRENIGYLWIFGEPLLLAVAIGALHSNQQIPLEGNVRSVPFAFSGYTLFIMFRAIVGRAEGLLEANRPLLNHRRVTLLDMLIARGLLEIATTTTVMTVLVAVAIFLGYADPPADLTYMAAAIAMMAWFSFGMSMVVVFLVHESRVAQRLIHPILYIAMPLSGAFYSMSWFDRDTQAILAWVPTVPIFETLRYGMFAGYSSEHVDLTYPIALSAVLTLLGLAMVRFLRPRIQIA